MCSWCEARSEARHKASTSHLYNRITCIAIRKLDSGRICCLKRTIRGRENTFHFFDKVNRVKFTINVYLILSQGHFNTKLFIFILGVFWIYIKLCLFSTVIFDTAMHSIFYNQFFALLVLLALLAYASKT